MERFEQEFIIPYDVKGRKAPQLVQEVAYAIPGCVYLVKDKREINLNSLLGVLSLGLKKGDKVVLSAYQPEHLNILLNIFRQEEE